MQQALFQNKKKKMEYFNSVFTRMFRLNLPIRNISELIFSQKWTLIVLQFYYRNMISLNIHQRSINLHPQN